MSSTRKILFISPTWPLGKSYGAQMRALQVTRALKQLGDVTVLVVGSNANDDASAQQTRSEFGTKPPVREHLTLNRGPIHRLQLAFDPRYLDVHGVAASSIDRARVAGYLEDYDLVWVMNSRTANIIPIWRWPHTHLDIDDVPSTCIEAMPGTPTLQKFKNHVRRIFLRNRERSLGSRFTTLSVCSEADRQYLGGARMHVIPNGFNRPTLPPQRRPSSERPRLGFIGLYSYLPNLDGMQWFLRQIWPLIRSAVPEITLRLVGKHTDGPLKPTDPGVDALGWQADPSAEIATWAAMVVPIRFGGGTRIKIVDAFSRKCPVVATHFGAHGYEVGNGRQLRLADEPAAFAAACIELVRDPAGAAAMAERAWNDFLTKWTWDAIAPKIYTAAEDCLRQGRVETSPVTRFERAVG